MDKVIHFEIPAEDTDLAQSIAVARKEIERGETFSLDEVLGEK